MNWFTPKLEPGERVVLKRSTGQHMLWLLALILFVFLPLEFGLLLAGELASLSPGRALVLLAAATASLTLVILPSLLGSWGWRLAVTNRRVILRAEGTGSDIEEIGIHEIETIQPDYPGNRILLRGQTAVLNLDATLVRLEQLKEAIAAAKGAAP